MVGRHKKPEERKSYHMRVPLTAGQRALIEDAIKLDLAEKAGWARAMLITAAKRTIAQNNEEMGSDHSTATTGEPRSVLARNVAE